VNAEAIGRLVGTLLILAAVTVIPIVWSRRMKARGNGRWWVPLLVGAILVIALAASLVTRGLGGDEVERVDPAALLGRVEGLSLAELPSETLGQIEQQYLGDPALGEHIEQIEARSIADADGAQLGGLVILTIDPEVAAEPGQEEGLARGLSESAGSPAERIDISGQRVISVTSEEQGLTYLAWQHGNLFINVTAADPEAARQAAAAVVEASRG